MKFFDSTEIPNETWLLIFEHLDTNSLRSIRAVSPRFRALGDILWKKFVRENIASDEIFWSLRIQVKKQQNSAYVENQIYFETIQANIKLIRDIESKLNLPSHGLFDGVKNFFKNLFKENQFKSKEEAMFAILQNGFDILWQKYLDKHELQFHSKEWKGPFTKILNAAISSNNPSSIKNFFEHLNNYFGVMKYIDNVPQFFICKGKFILHKPLFATIDRLIEDDNSVNEIIKILISYCVYPINYSLNKSVTLKKQIVPVIQDFPYDYPVDQHMAFVTSESSQAFRQYLYHLKYSCLSKCIEKNKTSLAEYLLEYAELNKNNFLLWCIDKAFEENKVTLFVFLIKKADKFIVELKTKKAQDENKDEIFKALIKNGLIAVNQKDYKEQTLLHKAVIKGDFDMVKLLCENGAQIDIEDNLHWTPVDHAFEKESIEILSYLLKICPRIVNKQNKEGKTLLHFAVENALVTGRHQVIQLLLRLEASIEIKDDEGKTPLDYIEDKSSSIAQLFAEENKAEEKSSFCPN